MAQLVAAGAEVNVRDQYATTALMKAAGNGHSAIVAQLVAAGAEVNVRDKDGETALLVAVREGESAVVEQLVAAGAEVNWQDEDGETALMVAVRGGGERYRAALKSGGGRGEQPRRGRRDGADMGRGCG